MTLWHTAFHGSIEVGFNLDIDPFVASLDSSNWCQPRVYGSSVATT